MTYVFGPGGFMIDRQTFGIINRLATDQHAYSLTITKGDFGALGEGLRLSLKCEAQNEGEWVHDYAIVGTQVVDLGGVELGDD